MKYRIAAFSLSLTALLCASPRPSLAMHAAGPLPAVTISNQNMALTLQVGGGLANGEAREVVYTEDEAGGEFKLSELFWDIEDVVMAGGSIAVQIGPRYRVSAGVWVAVTEGKGRMDDYDWLLGPDAPWTDWSLSDVEVRDTYALDINAAAEVYRYQNLGFSAVLGYRQDQWSWEDRGRRFIYSQERLYDSVGEFNGLELITYEQRFRIPYLGVVATLHGTQASAEVYCHYSPLVEAEDHDVHLQRDTTFKGKGDGGDYFGAGLRAGYQFTKNVSLAASAEWQVVEELRANTTIIAPEGTERNPDSAGIANQWMMLSLSLGYTF